MDFISKAKRSAVMSRIRGRGNKRTEISFISLLRKSGINGWRRHQIIHFDIKRVHREIASDGTIFKTCVKPDFLFPKLKVALFIDGCFWHGCLKCYRSPKTRMKFWAAKIQRNRERDLFQTQALRLSGWRVIRVREHDLTVKNKGRLSQRIERLFLS